MVTYETVLTVCWILVITAMIFSWVTIATRNWLWYLPTVIFGVAGLALSVLGQFAF